MLVENSGHVVSKDELMKAIWANTFVEEGGLTRNISSLRKALEEDLVERCVQISRQLDGCKSVILDYRVW